MHRTCRGATCAYGRDGKDSNRAANEGAQKTIAWSSDKHHCSYNHCTEFGFGVYFGLYFVLELFPNHRGQGLFSEVYFYSPNISLFENIITSFCFLDSTQMTIWLRGNTWFFLLSNFPLNFFLFCFLKQLISTSMLRRSGEHSKQPAGQ